MINISVFLKNPLILAAFKNIFTNNTKMVSVEFGNNIRNFTKVTDILIIDGCIYKNLLLCSPNVKYERLLILTNEHNISELFLDKQIDGLIPDDLEPEEIIQICESLYNGYKVIHRIVLKWKHFDDFSTNLSQREFQVLDFISQVFSNQQIATTLCLSEGTVKAVTNKIYQKLNVSNRSEATRKYLKRNNLQQ